MFFVLAPLMLLGGCTTSNVNQNYGNAYEQMVREQTFDISTRNTGQGDRVLQGTDPDYANKTLQEMRKDTANRATIQSAGQANMSPSGGGGGGSSGSSGTASGSGGGSQ
ncbi:MAG: hypothetical protein WB646_12335 [Steroidobacteraceae bacterium]